MKHRLFALVLCAVFVFCWITPVSAARPSLEPPEIGIDIFYWYCDTDNIGSWNSSTIDVYVGSNSAWSSLSYTNIISYMNTARQSWGVTGVSFSYVSSQDSADLVVGGITREEARQLGISDSVLGITYPELTSSRIKPYYNGAQKNYYSISGCTIFLIESQSNNSPCTANDYRKVAVHEAGHAFGYLGHYDGGCVMPALFEDIVSTTPDPRENNHLGQFY